MPPKPAGPAKRRTFVPKFRKPEVSYCNGCPLETAGQGYVPAYSPGPRKILLVGESPWFDEVALGEPMVGAAGSMLSRVVKLIGHQREDYSIDNVLRCAVPEMQVERWPHALGHCQYVDDQITQQQPQVVVPLGSTALRRVLGLPKGKNLGVENFHGTVTRDPSDRFWVVPTYHPSYLQRGATNLMGVVAFDLTRAHEVAEHGWAPDPGVLVIDPPIDWFRAWAQGYIAAVRQDPFAYPLAVDIETPEKGADEGALIATAADDSYRILQVNLSCHPDEGVTVPYEGEYIAIIDAVLTAGGVQYYWYKGYDQPRLVAAGHALDPRRAWDCMWMWKAIQSDLPMGLGFAAPFYSRWGAWKHLNQGEPKKYAAIDGLQTRRVGDGLVGDLVAEGQWPVFDRHMHEWHRTTLAPATDVGVPIDRARLMEFKAKLDGAATRLLGEIADAVPAALRPLTPKQGLTRPPDQALLHSKARDTKKDGTAKKDAGDPVKLAHYARSTVVEQLVIREVLVCRTCGRLEVTRTHRCQPGLPVEGAPTMDDGKPFLEKAVATVTRWFWQEPFNPDSPAQLLAYAKANGHTTGKAKTTGQDSMDRETLLRLVRETQGDPVYTGTLEYRAVQKVRGTYVIGTEKRLDADDRVHPQTTFKPSTQRTSQVNPNLQNVVADKGGEKSLASGFRHCVVARGRWVEDGCGWEDADGAT